MLKQISIIISECSEYIFDLNCIRKLIIGHISVLIILIYISIDIFGFPSTNYNREGRVEKIKRHNSRGFVSIPANRQVLLFETYLQTKLLVRPLGVKQVEISARRESHHPN